MSFLPLKDRVTVFKKTLIGSVNYGGGLFYAVVIAKEAQDPFFVVESRNLHFVGETGSLERTSRHYSRAPPVEGWLFALLQLQLGGVCGGAQRRSDVGRTSSGIGCGGTVEFLAERPPQHFAAHVEDSRPIRVDQWRFGADSVKPTVLRVMGAPSARFEVWKHVAQLRGINEETGEFRTASAKEYPTQLSKAIAHVILTEVKAKIQRGQWQFWERQSFPTEVGWLHDMHVYSAQIRADAVRLPDFQG